MTNQDGITRIEELARMGMLEAAEAACRELLAAAPQEHRAWAWLGMLSLARGRPADSESALRQAITLEPRDGRYWNTLALALRLQGKAAEGELAARNALALDAAADHWVTFANCLGDQQRWPEAAQAYR